MAAIVDSVRPLERFPVETDLSEKFLMKNENGSKETPENRAEKIQELLRILEGKFSNKQIKFFSSSTNAHVPTYTHTHAPNHPYQQTQTLDNFFLFFHPVKN
ncbi:hypothetical protein Phum_PHUM113000 [Pediculus humanus corporis]|uniref:Uncharacterized protein n=1 Tax=Pediculus humanus subsp. corporis TaxID=121224 RepID=E0VDE7_PEDHC|nr:uncharacterized protein Phum_PHUM113000 [Pediculus humanus corporis]EEB11403.1 hypothetical protein Phum_PHUM113000 [Pediculus humanus corporis]